MHERERFDRLEFDDDFTTHYEIKPLLAQGCSVAENIASVLAVEWKAASLELDT